MFKRPVKNETQKSSENLINGTSSHLLWFLRTTDKDNFMHGGWGKVSVTFWSDEFKDTS